MKPELLRALLRMDLFPAHPALTGSPLPYVLRRQAARQVLDECRAVLHTGALSAVPGLDELEQSVLRRGAGLARPALRQVINATNVVLHTNLGRAPLSPRVAATVGEAARGYSSLEYDLSIRRRNCRGAAIEPLLHAPIGVEATLMINNNVAIMLPLLSALVAGWGVTISREELVKIDGGSWVPDILVRSRARLVEVGATNKTRPADYVAVLDAGGVQVLFGVHFSNFHIAGFTQITSLPGLDALVRSRDVLLFCDLGFAASGSPELVGAVAWTDVCCFFGGKLLGEPQARVLLGRAEPLGRLWTDFLSRALRPGKLALIALEFILLDRRDGAAVPVSAMFSAPSEELRRRMEALAETFSPLHPYTATEAQGEVGGDAHPGESLPTWMAALGPTEALEARPYAQRVPILDRIHWGKLLLDVCTLLPGDEAEIAVALVVQREERA